MFKLPEGRPAVMGILNVTPDSFSDGGLHFGFRVALDAACKMIDDGADIIDVGGESTRPGAEEVHVAEEIRRVMPVIEKLLRKKIPVSIDTMKPEVARVALRAGVEVLNDVSGLRNPEMMETCASSGCCVCIMHMQGDPRTMQLKPRYENVVAEVRDYLVGQAERAEAAGIDKSRIWIDPGIGFGKTLAHNLTLIRHLSAFVETGYDVLIGVSRKSFIGRLLGGEDSPLPVEERGEGTLALQVVAQMNGARIIRAHDVRETRRAVDAVAALSRI